MKPHSKISSSAPLLEVGAARVEMTPGPGLALAGYLLRRGRAKGVQGPLCARALAFRLRGSGAVVLALDLLAIPSTWGERVVKRIARACNIPRRNVIIAATHTHAAPPLGFEPFWFASVPFSSAEKRFAQQTLRAAVAAARAAWNGLRPAKARHGVAWASGLATLRRPAARRKAAAQFPVQVLCLEGAKDSPLAWLCHFACHPTVLGPKNLRYSPDLFGAAAAELEREIPLALFLNGACADVSTRFTRRSRSPAEAQRLGKQLAVAARQAAERAQSFAPRELRLSAARVILLAGSRASPGDRFTARALAHLAGWKFKRRCVLAVLQLAPWTLVAIPGELPHAAGRAISRSGFVWPVCYANGYQG